MSRITVETCCCGASVVAAYAADLSSFRKAHRICRGLPDDEVARMVEVFIAKHRFHLQGQEFTLDDIDGVVSTVVADTMLVLEGTLSMEDFE